MLTELRLAISRWIDQFRRTRIWRVLRWISWAAGVISVWTGLTAPEQVGKVAEVLGFVGPEGARWILVAGGLLLVSVASLIRSPEFNPDDWVAGYGGGIIRREQAILGNYSTACDLVKGTWYLKLVRPDSDTGTFRCIVEHETGSRTRKEFTQAGRIVMVRYPDDFEVRGMPMAQPWGGYSVTWEVLNAAGKVQGNVPTTFEWRPLA